MSIAEEIGYHFEKEYVVTFISEPVGLGVTLATRRYYVCYSYKRVQYHYEDKHILCEFILLELLQDNNSGSLDLLNIFDEINKMSTEVSYDELSTGNVIELPNNIKVYNNLFLNKY